MSFASNSGVFSTKDARSRSFERLNNRGQERGVSRYLYDQLECGCLQDDLRELGLIPAVADKFWGYDIDRFSGLYWHATHCYPNSPTMCKRHRKEGAVRKLACNPTTVMAMRKLYVAERERTLQLSGYYKQLESVDMERCRELNEAQEVGSVYSWELSHVHKFCTLRAFPFPGVANLPNPEWFKDKLHETALIHSRNDGTNHGVFGETMDDSVPM